MAHPTIWLGEIRDEVERPTCTAELSRIRVEAAGLRSAALAYDPSLIVTSHRAYHPHVVTYASTLGYMSEPARDLPASSPAVEKAVELARRGVITHLTIRGERVAAIVPESVIEALRAAEDAEDAAEADAAWDEPGKSIPLDELEAEFGH